MLSSILPKHLPRHCNCATGAGSAIINYPYQLRKVHTSQPVKWDEYDNTRWTDMGEDAWTRAREAFLYDWKRAKRRYAQAQEDSFKRRGIFSNVHRKIISQELIPAQTDFLIIGGGIVGSSIAWWIKQRVRDEDMTVTVVECDDTFTKSATVLSAGGIRQQFSLRENVQMSMFSAEFLRNAGMHLKIEDNESPDCNIMPMGYLFLANSEAGAKQMEKNWRLQTELGARVALMNRDQLEQRFPFMNFDSIQMGSFGLENEGAIDPWQVLSAFREKNLTLGVQYVKARVEGFLRSDREEAPRYLSDTMQQHSRSPTNMIRATIVRPQKTDSSPRPIKAMCVVNAAGPWAGEVARMAGCGLEGGALAVPVPIVPRKRYVYVVHCPDGPGLDMPFLMDPSGVWCRRESLGHTYICGKSPETEEEDLKMDHTNLDVDYDYFQEEVWPVLARRVPAFEKLKIKSAWAGYYDYNTFDQNAIIGSHPAFFNFFHACGFSGHGLQHAIPTGRAVMEKWIDGAYRTINMKKFDFTRIMSGRKLEETQIV